MDWREPPRREAKSDISRCYLMLKEKAIGEREED
jgi:hypothetical protein